MGIFVAVEGGWFHYATLVAALVVWAKVGARLVRCIRTGDYIPTWD